MSNLIYGWYSDADQTSPMHDPPHNTVCLLCGEAIFAEDVRTISIMWADSKGDRSYFYRVHRTCHERASEPERQKIDEIVFDMIDRG